MANPYIGSPSQAVVPPFETGKRVGFAGVGKCFVMEYISDFLFQQGAGAGVVGYSPAAAEGIADVETAFVDNIRLCVEKSYFIVYLPLVVVQFYGMDIQFDIPGCTGIVFQQSGSPGACFPVSDAKFGILC